MDPATLDRIRAAVARNAVPVRERTIIEATLSGASELQAARAADVDPLTAHTVVARHLASAAELRAAYRAQLHADAARNAAIAWEAADNLARQLADPTWTRKAGRAIASTASAYARTIDTLGRILYLLAGPVVVEAAKEANEIDDQQTPQNAL